MYRVKNLTHYSSSKVWSTVEHGLNVSARIPVAPANSTESELQSEKTAKTEDTTKHVTQEKLKRKNAKKAKSAPNLLKKILGAEAKVASKSDPEITDAGEKTLSVKTENNEKKEDTAKCITEEKKITEKVNTADDEQPAKKALGTETKNTSQSGCEKNDTALLATPKQKKKNLKESIEYFYHYLRRMPMTNEERICDIIARWDTNQVDGMVPSVSGDPLSFQIRCKPLKDQAAPLAICNTDDGVSSCTDQEIMDLKLKPRPLRITVESDNKVDIKSRIQTTFLVDPAAMQFMDREYREAYFCRKFPEQRPDSSMQKAILASSVRFPTCDDQISKQYELFPPRRDVQLEILLAVDLPIQKRYFVPNGPRGLLWLRAHVKARCTKGILKEEEILEYEVSEAYIRKFRIIFPGKVLIPDPEVKRQVFKPLDMDLDKIFEKKKISAVSDEKTEVIAADDKCTDEASKSVDQVDLLNDDKKEVVANDDICPEANTDGLDVNNNLVSENMKDIKEYVSDSEDGNKPEEDVSEKVEVVAEAETEVVVEALSNIEQLNPYWIQDMIMGNFPRLKETVEGSHKEAPSVSDTGKKTGEKRTLLNRMRKFGRRIKQKFGRNRVNKLDKARA